MQARRLILIRSILLSEDFESILSSQSRVDFFNALISYRWDLKLAFSLHWEGFYSRTGFGIPKPCQSHFVFSNASYHQAARGPRRDDSWRQHLLGFDPDRLPVQPLRFWSGAACTCKSRGVVRLHASCGSVACLRDWQTGQASLPIG